METPYYESDAAVAQYLLFHYGTPEQICPWPMDMRSACGFPARCVSTTLPFLAEGNRRRALDLGCAVGRSSFELASAFPGVIALDFSKKFIAAAEQMQRLGEVTISVPTEGQLHENLRLELPPALVSHGGNIHFQTGDAMQLDQSLGVFDYILMANLIDRLPDPAACLQSLASLVSIGGLLVLTSPYTWLEDYTPRSLWLSREEPALAAISSLLKPHFSLEQRLDLPFLIREHRRKYQWSLAETSVWRRQNLE